MADAIPIVVALRLWTVKSPWCSGPYHGRGPFYKTLVAIKVLKMVRHYVEAFLESLLSFFAIYQGWEVNPWWECSCGFFAVEVTLELSWKKLALFVFCYLDVLLFSLSVMCCTSLVLCLEDMSQLGVSFVKVRGLQSFVEEIEWIDNGVGNEHSFLLQSRRFNLYVFSFIFLE